METPRASYLSLRASKAKKGKEEKKLHNSNESLSKKMYVRV